MGEPEKETFDGTTEDLLRAVADWIGAAIP